MTLRSIAAINQLPEPQKREIYSRFIPPQLLEQFNISMDFNPVDRWS